MTISKSLLTTLGSHDLTFTGRGMHWRSHDHKSRLPPSSAGCRVFPGYGYSPRTVHQCEYPCGVLEKENIISWIVLLIFISWSPSLYFIHSNPWKHPIVKFYSHGTPPTYRGSLVSVEDTPALPIPGCANTLSTYSVTTFLDLTTLMRCHCPLQMSFFAGGLNTVEISPWIEIRVLRIKVIHLTQTERKLETIAE